MLLLRRRNHLPADLAGKQGAVSELSPHHQGAAAGEGTAEGLATVSASGPSAAKENIQPAPEGVWSASSKSSVSQEALYEAEVLVDEVEPLSPRKRCGEPSCTRSESSWPSASASAHWKMWSASAQERAFRKALASVDKENEAKLTPEIAAEVHRLVGEYYLRSGELDHANDEFKKARGSLARAGPGTVERDAALIDLALSQVDLGGSKAQTKDHARLKWDDAQTELRQTLQKLSTTEARVEAIRLLTRKLLAHARIRRLENRRAAPAGRHRSADQRLAAGNAGVAGRRRDSSC